jgi:type I restriction enzyme M protein
MDSIRARNFSELTNNSVFIVRLLTDVIEPCHGRILDPACASGGMFVSFARFVTEHKRNPAAELSIHGVEKTDEAGRLCRLNLPAHGLEGDIRHGGNVNSLYDDPHDSTIRDTRYGRRV